jgi:tetratricopeptide (TPR) repeat protein
MDLLVLAREATAAKDWANAANYWRQYLDTAQLTNERDAAAALRVFVLTKHMDDAKKIGMFARKAYPESVPILRLFAQVMVASKHWQKVMDLSRQIFKLLPEPALSDYVSFLSALIQFIRRNPVERAEVLGYFDQAMAHHGRHYRLVSIKARYFEIVHDYPAACAEWQYLSEHQLDDMSVFNWNEYIRVLHASGLFEQAKQQLDVAQARFPDSKELAADRKKNEILSQTTYQVLAEDPMYKVTYFKQKQPTDVMFITFGTAPTTITSTPFGQDFLLKQGFDLIYVAQAVRTQYQGLSIEAFYEAVKSYN